MTETSIALAGLIASGTLAIAVLGTSGVSALRGARPDPTSISDEFHA